MPLKYAETIQKMTLEEKASLCSGHDYWHSEGVPSAGAIQMSPPFLFSTHHRL